ncbi:TPM domain-containing protein [Pseudomonas huanghezhanensis]|uniref:TPM domain-containing protein n=1 Tax=Pseudomonas huanghezhanensis TaxID=3002903 RepID=UPI00228590AB|nr:TPM domain-containing protein [Pseudomonas sp. BSw22131]
MRALRRALQVASLCVCAVLVTLPAHAALSFPALTGQVVDTAGMLDAPSTERLSQMLRAHQQLTTEQVVVVTVPNLQGTSIEDYGYQLGRHWGIGQKDKDNGALLIVARDDRKVRIEVGYGLEGRLTDAQSSVIINQVITPAFKKGDFVGGITQGTEAIVQVLGGDPLAEPAAGATGNTESSSSLFESLAFLVLLLIFIFINLRGGRGRSGGAGYLGAGALGGLGGLGSRGGGGGSGGGGFSGGGGSFGGGGASGSW